MTILTDLKRSLMKNLNVVCESSLQNASSVRLSNYELIDFWVKPENRSFNITLDYDSDEGIDGISFLKIVETFDPMLNFGSGGPPDEISEKFDESGKLQDTLPEGWTFDEASGFIYHEINANEFKSLLQKYNLLKILEQQLYDIAYAHAQENKEFVYIDNSF